MAGHIRFPEFFSHLTALLTLTPESVILNLFSQSGIKKDLALMLFSNSYLMSMSGKEATVT